MIPEYAPYDPTDSLEQLADRVRQEICDIALRQLNARQDKGPAADDAFQFMVMGMLTGVAGTAIAHFQMDDDTHLTLRKWLHECLTQAFDQARSMHDLPPLPEATPSKLPDPAAGEFIDIFHDAEGRN
jgi:hypothetical protein